MRCLVIGAGVIGQVYAGRLATAGHDITLMARGEHAGDLLKKGIRLDTRGQTATCRVAVTTTAPAGEDYDCVLVAVRFDQLHPALEVARTVSAQQVVTLCNVPDRADRLPVLLGRDQVILAFPGVGGRIGEDGVVHYADVRQQHTSIGKADGAERQLALALRSAQFPVDLVDDMPAWLTTHALFIASVGAAILLSGVTAQRWAGTAPRLHGWWPLSQRPSRHCADRAYGRFRHPFAASSPLCRERSPSHTGNASSAVPWVPRRSLRTSAPHAGRSCLH